MDGRRMKLTLYTLEGCPKCDILRKKCEENPQLLTNFEFEEIKINRDNPDSLKYINYLSSQGIEDMPVLDVEGVCHGFQSALNFIRKVAPVVKE